MESFSLVFPGASFNVPNVFRTQFLKRDADEFLSRTSVFKKPIKNEKWYSFGDIPDNALSDI